MASHKSVGSLQVLQRPPTEQRHAGSGVGLTWKSMSVNGCLSVIYVGPATVW